MSDPVRALFVAADENRCARAAFDIGEVSTGIKIVGATDLEGVRTALDETRIDCVVFAENPLTAEGARLDKVAEACSEIPDGDPVPIVLFTDESYGPSTAKATDAVADYVCSEAEDAFEHLADRIKWNTADDPDDPSDPGSSTYETLVESMEDGVLVFDRDGWIEYANDAIDDVFGLEENYEGIRFRGLVDWELVSAEDAERVERAVETVLSGDERSASPEVTITPADGDDHRVVEFQVVPLPGEEGSVLATVRNVTEYKRAESALEETRSKIQRLHAVTDEMAACRSERELFEHTVDAADRILELDVCGVDVVENDRFVPKATLGEDYGGSPADRGVGGHALSTGESILVDDLADRPRASPVEDARSVLCVPVDTVALVRAASYSPEAFDERDRHLAELLAAHVGESLTRIRVGRTLQERQRALFEERERLMALFENVPSPVVNYAIEDGHPVIEDANPSFEETFGVDVNAVLGDRLHDHVRPPSSDPDDVADHDFINDLADIDAALGAGRNLETPVRRETADGVGDFLLHAGPLEQQDDVGYIIYTDISDQKRRERDLESRTGRLDRIAAVVDDDLRDRLNEARGYLELVAETRDPEDIAEVRRAHERMSRLIGDLRHLARRELDVSPTQVDVETVATRAWASVETGGADLEVVETTVVADRDRMEELLEQLFRNAAEHATTEDVSTGDLADDSGLTVRVGPLSDADGFFVADDGHGIPAPRRDRVFESGFSTAEDGAGLGLSVVERIARAHDWETCVCESAAGGARFEFETPEGERRRRSRRQRN